MSELAESQAAQPLRRGGWLAGTPTEFQDVVLDHCDLLDVAAGARIYHAGDDAGGMFGVVEGQIELHLSGPSDAPTLAHIASRGFWVGDMAALRGRHRRFSAVARSRCKLLRLSRVDMQRICSESPAF